MFLLAANSRSPVMANSRATITMTIQAGIHSSSMKAMNAEQISTLSARGSISFPKSVTRFRRRAMMPSNRSVKLAATKSTNAAVM